MTTVTPIRRPGRPANAPVMLTEDQARDAVREDLRVAAGVPADWWREDREVLVATHDRELAAQAADELARRDFGGNGGYLSLVRAGVSIEGPIPVVLVGEVGGARGKDLDIRPAGPDAPYALYVCLVRPAQARRVRSRSRAAAGRRGGEDR